MTFIRTALMEILLINLGIYCISSHPEIQESSLQVAAASKALMYLYSIRVSVNDSPLVYKYSLEFPSGHFHTSDHEGELMGETKLGELVKCCDALGILTEPESKLLFCDSMSIAAFPLRTNMFYSE